MKLIKKLFKWFKYNPGKELEIFGFKKINKDRTLFFPWGEPGESFFVTKKDQIIIVLTLIFYIALWCIAAFGLIYIDDYNLIHPSIDSRIMPLLFVYCGAFYVPLVFLITRNKEFNNIPQEQRVSRKKDKWYTWILYLLITILWLIMVPNNIFIPYSITLLLGLSFLCYIEYKLKKSKGYYFNK